MFDDKETFIGEKQIAEMLSSLRRVDAPGDFATRVRARIASERVSAGASAWTPNLVRAGVFAAAAVVVAVGGYFVFTSINTGQNAVPSVAEVQPQTPSQIEPLKTEEAVPQVPESPGSEIRVDNADPSSSDAGPKRSGTSGPNTNTESDRPGGSIDSAVRESQKLFPRGVDPNAKTPANAKGIDPNARINVSQILEFIGVKATWSGGGWRVDSVDANNIANRSGIKVGDVVEAINGQTVDKKTTFPSKFDGKGIRVRRDGASVQIDFKP